MAVLMAAAVFGFFVIPRALARHDYVLPAIAGTLFAAYVAFNAWLLIRLRSQRRS
jgi:hypothetical protein